MNPSFIRKNDSRFSRDQRVKKVERSGLKISSHSCREVTIIDYRVIKSKIMILAKVELSNLKLRFSFQSSSEINK